MAEDTNGTSSGESVYTEEEVNAEEGEGQTEDGKRVEWPPEANAYPEASVASKEVHATNGTNGVKVSTTNAMKVVKTKTKMVSESSVYHNSAVEIPGNGVIKTDLFRPGKLNMGNRWQGGGGQEDENGCRGGPPRPKAKLRDVEEILQTNSMTHSTYHVPPGTSRTRRAQDNYAKHLDGAIDGTTR